ncbi:4844_t:CDS:2 [Entrophospora sp. SA101]|nr:4844_t:CDS:2 [Entrophospora sp. SA101]
MPNWGFWDKTHQAGSHVSVLPGRPCPMENGQNKNQDLLTDHEFSELKSHMMSKFEFIGITEEIKQFVADNKRKFKMDSIDEIQQIIIKEHGKCQSNLINQTFFKLLDEYILWDNGTKTSIFTEITGPWKQNCKIKPYWDIYREGIHAKDAIDSDIRKNKSLKPDETKKSSFLLMSVQNLEDVMRIHQLLMSTKENAISYLEDSYTTPPHQVYSEWLCPTAGTPFKNPNLRITQEVAQI